LSISDISFPVFLQNERAYGLMDEWLAYRRRKRKPLKDAVYVSGFLREIADEFRENATDAFAEAVKNSIGEGYQKCVVPAEFRQRLRSQRRNLDPRGNGTSGDLFLQEATRGLPNE